MKKEIEVFNLNCCNPTVHSMKNYIKEYKKVWVGFHDKRYFILDAFLFERFIQNLNLEDDDLIEEIF
jgi:hypothetical protein